MHAPPRPIWERQPREPALWFARFETYRLLGPERTLHAARRATGRISPNRIRKPEAFAGGSWYTAAQRWNWQARAEAWDEHVRDQVRAHEEQRRFDSRETRLRMIDQLLKEVFDALLAADLDTMLTADARAALPALRVLFRDLVAVQRSELNAPIAGSVTEPISAEDLQRAYHELARWNAAGNGADDSAHAPPAPPGAARGLPDPTPHAAPVDASDPKPKIENPKLDILAPHARARLSSLLAQLYPDAASTRRIAALAGLHTEHIALAAAAADSWYAVVVEAEHADKLADLAAVVRDDYPGNRRLLEALVGF